MEQCASPPHHQREACTRQRYHHAVQHPPYSRQHMTFMVKHHGDTAAEGMLQSPHTHCQHTDGGKINNTVLVPQYAPPFTQQCSDVTSTCAPNNATATTIAVLAAALLFTLIIIQALKAAMFTPLFCYRTTRNSNFINFFVSILFTCSGLCPFHYHASM